MLKRFTQFANRAKILADLLQAQAHARDLIAVQNNLRLWAVIFDVNDRWKGE